LESGRSYSANFTDLDAQLNGFFLFYCKIFIKTPTNQKKATNVKEEELRILLF
jgi:hypothetical protein